MKLFLISENQLIPTKILNSDNFCIAIFNNDMKNSKDQTSNKLFLLSGKTGSFDIKNIMNTKQFKSLQKEHQIQEIVEINKLSPVDKNIDEKEILEAFIDEITKNTINFDTKLKVPNISFLEKTISTDTKVIEKLSEYDEKSIITPLKAEKSNHKTKKSDQKKSAKIKPKETQNEDFGIPKIPLKKGIKIEIDDLISRDISDKEAKNPDIKMILVDCEMCGKETITMPISKKTIENSKLPVTEITYVHSDPPHAITVYIDKDYAVRRRRASSVMFQKKSINREK